LLEGLRRRLMGKKKKRRRFKREENNFSAYSTLPYYYPTEQVDNLGKLRKKKRGR